MKLRCSEIAFLLSSKKSINDKSAYNIMCQMPRLFSIVASLVKRNRLSRFGFFGNVGGPDLHYDRLVLHAALYTVGFASSYNRLDGL